MSKHETQSLIPVSLYQTSFFLLYTFILVCQQLHFILAKSRSIFTALGVSYHAAKV